MALLGYSSITLTAITYVWHVGRAAIKDAAHKMDAAPR
jgi:hypothetical protein